MLGGFCSPVDCPVHTETTSKPSSNNPAAAVLALISAVLSLSAHRQAAHKDDNSQRKGCTILEIFGVEERGPNLTPAPRRRYPLARTTPAFILAPRRLRMVALSALWLPIVLSAVIVFVASSIMHMVLPYHRSDYQPLPDEDKVLAALRAAGLQRGLYMFPFSTHKEMKSPATIEKFKQGPVGMLTVFPSGPPAMPKFLGMWFAYCLIIGLFVAYLAGHTVAFGAHYRKVFGVAGLAAFLAYSLGPLVNGIWKGQPWSMVLKESFDGLIYSPLKAGLAMSPIIRESFSALISPGSGTVSRPVPHTAE